MSLADDLARLNRALDHIADPGRSRHELRVLGLDPEQLVPRHAAVEDERGTSARPAAPRAAPPPRAADEGRAARAVASAALPAPSDAPGLRPVVGLENPHEVTERRSPGRLILYGLAWTAGVLLLAAAGIAIGMALGFLLAIWAPDLLPQ